MLAKRAGNFEISNIKRTINELLDFLVFNLFFIFMFVYIIRSLEILYFIKLEIYGILNFSNWKFSEF